MIIIIRFVLFTIATYLVLGQYDGTVVEDDRLAAANGLAPSSELPAILQEAFNNIENSGVILRERRRRDASSGIDPLGAHEVIPLKRYGDIVGAATTYMNDSVHLKRAILKRASGVAWDDATNEEVAWEYSWIKSQGSCGSCYAMSLFSALEWHFNLLRKHLRTGEQPLYIDVGHALGCLRDAGYRGETARGRTSPPPPPLPSPPPPPAAAYPSPPAPSPTEWRRPTPVECVVLGGYCTARATCGPGDVFTDDECVEASRCCQRGSVPPPPPPPMPPPPPVFVPIAPPPPYVKPPSVTPGDNPCVERGGRCQVQRVCDSNIYLPDACRYLGQHCCGVAGVDYSSRTPAGPPPPPPPQAAAVECVSKGGYCTGRYSCDAGYRFNDTLRCIDVTRCCVTANEHLVPPPPPPPPPPAIADDACRRSGGRCIDESLCRGVIRENACGGAVSYVQCCISEDADCVDAGGVCIERFACSGVSRTGMCSASSSATRECCLPRRKRIATMLSREKRLAVNGVCGGGFDTEVLMLLYAWQQDVRLESIAAPLLRFTTNLPRAGRTYGDKYAWPNCEKVSTENSPFLLQKLGYEWDEASYGEKPDSYASLTFIPLFSPQFADMQDGREEADKALARESIMAAVDIGPVSVAISVNCDEFRGRRGRLEITRGRGCGRAPVNHAVVVVGYHFEGHARLSDSYWIVQNSWGYDDGSGYVNEFGDTLESRHKGRWRLSMATTLMAWAMMPLVRPRGAATNPLLPRVSNEKLYALPHDRQYVCKGEIRSNEIDALGGPRYLQPRSCTRVGNAEALYPDSDVMSLVYDVSSANRDSVYTSNTGEFVFARRRERGTLPSASLTHLNVRVSMSAIPSADVRVSVGVAARGSDTIAWGAANKVAATKSVWKGDGLLGDFFGTSDEYQAVIRAEIPASARSKSAYFYWEAVVVKLEPIDGGSSAGSRVVSGVRGSPMHVKAAWFDVDETMTANFKAEAEEEIDEEAGASLSAELIYVVIGAAVLLLLCCVLVVIIFCLLRRRPNVPVASAARRPTTSRRGTRSGTLRRSGSRRLGRSYTHAKVSRDGSRPTMSINTRSLRRTLSYERRTPPRSPPLSPRFI